MRRHIFTLAGLLLAAVAALLLALRSEPFVLGAIRWALPTFTGLHLELHNPRLDVYRGTFSADEIHLIPGPDQGQALLSVLALDASIPESIRAESVQIYVADNTASSNPRPMQWLGYLRWLPHKLSIGQVHLITASANTWIFPLKHLVGEKLPSGHYLLGADADYAGEPLTAAVDLSAVDKGWGQTEAEATITLLAPDSGSVFSLAGTLAGTGETFNYRFDIQAFYRDVHEFLRGFDGGKDLAGELHLNGTMVGDTGGFVLSNARFVLDNMPEYGFEAEGSLEYRLSGESNISLLAAGELASLSYLVDWADLDVGDFGLARSSVRLSGSLDRPVIDEFRLTTSNESGLTISLTGKLNLFAPEPTSRPGENAVLIEIQGPSLAALQPWLGTLTYDTGAWRASARLTGQQKQLALEDILVEAGTAETLQLHASGAVGSLTLAEDPGGKYRLDNIALQLQAQAPDSAALNGILGRSDIPPYQAVVASAEIRGSGESLQLSNGQLKVTASDLQLDIGPLSATLQPNVEPLLSELAAPVTLRLSDFSALSQYVKQEVPVLGPVQLTARLAQKGEQFQLLDIVSTIGEGQGSIRTTGRIANLAGPSGVSLDSTLAGIDTGKLLSSLLPDFSYTQPLGALSGTFKLVDTKGAWNIPALALATGDEQAPLALSIKGSINDVLGLPTANLDTRFRITGPELLDALTGMPLATLIGSLVVATSGENIEGKLQARVGETQLDGEAHAGLKAGTITGVKLALATPHLYLGDFTVAHSRKPEDRDEDEDKPGTLLERLRDKSPAFPVDASLRIGGISGANSNIDSLLVHITGMDKRYTLEQFSASYNQALAEIRGIIDLNPALPALSLAGQATALPLSAILKDVGITSNVTGALTILGGITLMGDSAEVLVQNLNGSVAFALEDAVIDGAAYDLLATDLLAWIYSGALTEKSTRLDCTMAKFQLRQGVATTDSLYIESARMVASGKAQFDLVKRRMDLRITPLSKSRVLQVPSEVRLKGKMSDPKAEISPVSAVADATSAAIMLIPSLTLKLFGIKPSAHQSYHPCQADLAN